MIHDLKFHHLGVAVPELRAAIAFEEAAFGHHLVAGPFDDPIQGVSVCFVGNGSPPSPLIELVSPRSDTSPLSSYLKKGIGAYHVCYETAALETTIAAARQHGCIPIGNPVPAVAFGGRRIAWMFAPTRQLLEFLQA